MAITIRLNERGEVYCPTCDTHKPKSSFHKSKRHTLKLASQCKSCAKFRSRDAHLKTRYGLLDEDVQQLIIEQDNKCACCSNEFDNTHRGRAVVDHCHTTGAVRSILCDRCNVTLGMVGESPELCKNIMDYINAKC